MKTIKEWLEELPEPHRSRALNNADKRDFNVEYNSMRKTILGSFVWSKSPEGLDYWREISQGNYSAKPPYETTAKPPAKPGLTETKRVMTALVITAAVMFLLLAIVYADKELQLIIALESVLAWVISFGVFYLVYLYMEPKD